MAERGRGVWALLFFFYSVGCICSVSCLPYMQMLSSVSAKACCLMHTVAADCSLWSTVQMLKIRLSYQILKWMEYRALEMNHYEPFF